MSSERPYFLAYLDRLIGTEGAMRQMNPYLTESSQIRERCLTELKGLISEGKHMAMTPEFPRQVKVEVLSSTPNVPAPKPANPPADVDARTRLAQLSDEDRGRLLHLLDVIQASPDKLAALLSNLPGDKNSEQVKKLLEMLRSTPDLVKACQDIRAAMV